MKEKKYIIRYKLSNSDWSYFTRLTSNGGISWSVYNPNSKAIMVMTLKVAEKYIEHIKKIKGEYEAERSEIQILNIETNKTVNFEQIKADKEFLSREEIPRFELIDFD